MRNLKRALSLTLASVMLLGMMVVGSSAAGYPDVSEEENIEAIEVLQSVGVMEGDNNGNFNPDDYVTREQMAVIMSKLLNLDYNYYQGTNPFSDVPAWAAPYVAACAANGITSGIGGGMYGAGQNVNAVQAALMMLKALGYFQYQADFGDSYILATVKQATEVGMFAGIDSKSDQALTRNEVAQMALNALKSDMVRFTGDVGIELPNVGNVGYKSEYTPRTSTDPKYNRLIDNKHSSNIDTSGQYYIQLGEELYDGNLVQRYDSDIFERPSYTWTYKTELIGTYVDKAKLLASYTSGVTGRTLYDLLNNITLRDYDLEVYVDGHLAGEGSGYGTESLGVVNPGNQYTYLASKEEITANQLVRSNTSNVGATADGVLTEVYLDRDNEVITIASIHTWLAQGVSAYNETRESATMKVYMTNANGTSKTVNVEDVAEVEGVAADTFYLVRMSDKDTSKLEVVDIDEPQILAESTITQFSNGKKDNTATNYPTELTTDGTKYKDSDRAIYDAETLDTYDKDLLATNTYNVYLDKYGYFIGIDLCEGTKQYVFVTGYDMRNSNLSVKTAEAAGIFLDGTMDTITVNVTDTNKNIQSMVYGGDTNNWSTPKADGAEGSNAKAYYQKWATNKSDGVFLLNRWYTYTKTDAGVYTLKPCVDKDGKAMMLAAKTANDTDNDNVAETDGELKLNCAKLRLDGVNGTDAALLSGETMKYVGTGLSGHRAYGEDASVFITVDVDSVSGSFADNVKITRAITDVNGVYSGVQDVDIITKTTDRVVGDYLISDGSAAVSTTNDWSGTDDANVDNQYISDGSGKTYLGENAYAVYDKNNFIIGAVILGEAVGGTKNFAYVLDPVKNESYRDGTYYWQFEAVMNGEKVTLDAKSKFSSTIDTLRNNWHAMVELRFTDDVVTEVKAIGNEKIYEFNSDREEINTRQVDDDESIYDAILTGPNHGSDNSVDQDSSVNTNVKFKNVFRGNYNYNFGTTEIGYLNLQGRTLWVLNGQADYGIDFTKEAKAVVIQPENGKIEIREYDSVQSAVDSLGDPIPGNDVKEFYGIISAALNSQGVAEWVVFYSNTNVDTRNNVNGPVSYMDVDVRIKIGANGEASTWRTIQVARPSDGSDYVTIPTPEVIKHGPGGGPSIMPGWHVVETGGIPLFWEKNATGKYVVFTYEKDAPVNPLTAAKAAAQAVTELAAQEPALANQAAVIAAIQSAVVAAVNDGNVTVQVAASGTPSYTQVVNGTKGAGAAGTEGSVNVDITLSATGFTTETITNKTVAVKAMAYADTAAGKADVKIAAAKAALTKVAIEAKLTTAQDASLTETAAVALVQTAATGVLTDADTTVAGVSVAVVAKTGGAYVAPSAGNTAGSVEVTLTITLDPGTAETVDLTISIPSSVT